MSEIYFYEVGYNSCEENPYSVLSNEKFYTEEQFRELCSDITVDLYNHRKEIWKDEYEISEKSKEDDGLDPDHYDPRGSFEDLIGNVIKVLIDEHGFKSILNTARFMPFGWAKFIPKNDWREYTENDKDILAIRNKIK